MIKKLIITLSIILMATGVWAGTQPEKNPRNISPVNGDLEVVGNITVTGTGERITGTTEYIDFDDIAGGISISGEMAMELSTWSYFSGLTNLSTTIIRPHTVNTETYTEPSSEFEWLHINIAQTEIDALGNGQFINGTGDDEHICINNAGSCGDSADFTFDDSSNIGFAFWGYFNFTGSGVAQALASKTGAEDAREWLIQTHGTNGTLTVTFYDDSAANTNTCTTVTASSSIPSGWQWIAMEYSAASGGDGTSNAAAGDVTWLLNGVALTNDSESCTRVGAEYAGMTDTTAVVVVAGLDTGVIAFEGGVGNHYFKRLDSGALSASSWLRRYRLDKAFYGL